MAMDDGDRSAAGVDSADDGRRASRRGARRAGLIIAAVAAGVAWVLVLAWSITLLGALGTVAADRFEAAVDRFDERRATSELAFATMEAEVLEAELALERSDDRVQDSQTWARLDAAHASAGREIERLQDTLAGQVAGWARHGRCFPRGSGRTSGIGRPTTSTPSNCRRTRTSRRSPLRC